MFSIPYIKLVHLALKDLYDIAIKYYNNNVLVHHRYQFNNDIMYLISKLCLKRCQPFWISLFLFHFEIKAECCQRKLQALRNKFVFVFFAEKACCYDSRALWTYCSGIEQLLLQIWNIYKGNTNNARSKNEIKTISWTAKIEILPFIFISTPNSLRTSSFVSFFGSGDAKAVWMTSTANNPKIRNVKDILNEAESSVMA